MCGSFGLCSFILSLTSADSVSWDVNLPGKLNLSKKAGAARASCHRSLPAWDNGRGAVKGSHPPENP